MNRINDWENIQEANESGFSAPAPGGYVVTIVGVEDVPDKEYLKINFDIQDGEYANYALDTMEKAGFWPLSTIRSYKQTATKFFKGFITSVEKSNPGYSWNWDEHTLVGKKFAVVLGEEEYRNNNGGIGTKIVADRVMSIEAMKKGGFKVPEKKLLKTSAPATKPVSVFADASDEDLPF